MARVFVKLGGSYITDKKVTDSLQNGHVAAAASMLHSTVLRAREIGEELSMVLGHGAGSFGHIRAERYSAVQGVHPELGWEGFHKIRASMTLMNHEFMRCCARTSFYPVPVSPFSIVTAEDGRITRMDTSAIECLLEAGQVPLIHGDAVLDVKRGFTIASTEKLLAALAEKVRFDRVVMVADTKGVLDDKGATVGLIDGKNYDEVLRCLGGSGSPDVTGGMRRKVERLYDLVRSGRVGEARITRIDDRVLNLMDAVLGTGGGGTLLKP